MKWSRGKNIWINIGSFCLSKGGVDVRRRQMTKEECRNGGFWQEELVKNGNIFKKRRGMCVLITSGWDWTCFFALYKIKWNFVVLVLVTPCMVHLGRGGYYLDKTKKLDRIELNFKWCSSVYYLHNIFRFGLRFFRPNRKPKIFIYLNIIHIYFKGISINN